MRPLTLKLSHALWGALERHHRETGEPVHHIVRAALADYLQVDHQTLFQVSTSTALVEGIYRGAVTVGQLKQHGDFGLGTFEGIDGELVLLDGRAYQIRGDGVCHEVDDATASPLQVQALADLRVALPSSEEFLRADLTRDPSADLDRAER
jgi:acetolactate decarboxylase